jgi:hypothetical protein
MHVKFSPGLLFVLSLAAAACGFQREITVQKYEMQGIVDLKFPVDKDVVVATASLKYPDIYFLQGNQIGMKLQYTGRFLKKPAEGWIDLHGALVYKPEKGEFYLSKVETVGFTTNKESRANKDKLQGTIESIVGTLIDEVPFHRLKQKDFKPSLAKLRLKNVRVDNESLILTMGL